MRYIVCDDCEGYYKLESGESLEDFDECQCGGHLRYAQSFEETIKDRDVPTKTCVRCGAKHQERDIVCSNCGEKLRKINRRVADYTAREPQKTPIKILDRISFRSVLVGLIFLIIASVIAVFGLVGSVASSNGVDVLRSMGGYIILLMFAIIASGFISSYMSGAREYVDGLINGGMVGIALSVLGAFFVTILTMTFDVVMGIIAGLVTLIVYVLLYGSLTAFGGFIAVWMYKYTEDY